MPHGRANATLRACHHSEPASPLLWPALNNDLFLGEELERIAALAMKIAEETLTRAAEGKKRHRRRNSEVDADVAYLGFVPELSCARAARREQACLIPVLARVHEVDRFVDGVHAMNRQHRAEDFCAGQVAGEREAIENRRFDEVAAFAVRNFRIAPIDHEPC